MAPSQTSGPRRARHSIWILVGVVALVAAVVLWVMLAPPNTQRYQPLIAGIESKQLQPDDAGRVVLRGAYAGLTPHDEAFVQPRAGGGFLALIPTYYPKGPAIAGLLYTSRPFGLTDPFNHGLGIDVGHPFITVGPWGHLRIDSRIDDHWFKVSQGIE